MSWLVRPKMFSAFELLLCCIGAALLTQVLS